MRVPPQIMFRNMDHVDSVTALVKDRAQTLACLFADIISCRVVVEAGPHPFGPAKQFRVGITLHVPAGELSVSRGGPGDERSDDALATVRNAFATLRRRLEDHADIAHGRVKMHAEA